MPRQHRHRARLVHEKLEVPGRVIARRSPGVDQSVAPGSRRVTCTDWPLIWPLATWIQATITAPCSSTTICGFHAYPFGERLRRREGRLPRRRAWRSRPSRRRRPSTSSAPDDGRGVVGQMVDVVPVHVPAISWRDVDRRQPGRLRRRRRGRGDDADATPAGRPPALAGAACERGPPRSPRTMTSRYVAVPCRQRSLRVRNKGPRSPARADRRSEASPRGTTVAYDRLNPSYGVIEPHPDRRSTSLAMSDSTQADVRDVIVIGSGPAGYTAAIYAARADLRRCSSRVRSRQAAH